MSRRWAALVLALSLLGGRPAAAEATEIRVSDTAVDAAMRSIQFTVSAPDLPADAGLDPASIKVRSGSRVLPASAAVIETGESTAAPKVLLVIDTSGSMEGQPMAEAKEAVSAFLADSPAGAELGLMRFASAPELLVPPTTERTRLLGAVAALKAQGETSLYDAVLAGLQVLGSKGDRRLVVLSDGGDTRSSAALPSALRAAADSGVTVDAIGFNTDEAVSNVLRQLAGSGRGKVHEAASAADLSSALATTVRTHARTLTISVLVPEDLRGRQTLALSINSPAGRLETSTPVTLGAAAEAVASRGWWGSRNASMAGLSAIGLGLLLGCLVLLGGHGRDKRKVHAVLERYTTAARPVQQPGSGSPGTVVRTAVGLADKVVTARDLQDRLALRLDRAAVSMTPAEWLLLRAGITFGALLLLVLLGKNILLAAVIGGLLGTAGPALALRIRGGRRQKAFEEKLPDALQMVAGSLSAGYSLAQALDGLVREGSEPMAGEMGRALAESRLGVSVESTLDGVAERMGSKDFRWVVMAIRVQREVGGNLAGVLTTVSATMRERAMLRRHVRGLSAEGKLSAYILIALPIFLALYMLTLRPEYIRPLYTTGLGIVMIVAAGLLLAIGSFWMSRMVKVEV